MKLGEISNPRNVATLKMPDSTWRKRFARLAHMSGEEMFTRARQGFLKRWDSAPLLRQRGSAKFVSRAGLGSVESAQFFFSPEELPNFIRLIGNSIPGHLDRIEAQADRICQHRFNLLGYENLEYGAAIDWHLDAVSGKRAPRKRWFKIPYLDFAEVGDHKVIWELNRHQHLVTLAKAYCFTGNERYVRELCSQWYHWRQENPYSLGINWASSLEVAFRTLSWLWIRQLLANCSALPPEFHSDLLEALAQNGRHISRNLSTYFSPNTHLLGEAVALFFLGTLCPRIRAALDWRKQGWEIILAEAGRQVRPDGMHFEQSLYYHVYALDFFLQSMILARRNGQIIPASLHGTIETMAEILCALGQAGTPPKFGDDDGGRLFDPARNRAEHMLDPLATAAVLYGRADFKVASPGLCEETLWLLGAEAATGSAELPATRPIPVSRAFESSGIYVMASGAPGTQLLARAGPMGALRAGHSHCDSLNIQLSIGGNEILADPGTFQYVSGDGTRNAFRGTAAHNTLRIDGLDQAEPGDSFSWNSLPSVRVEHWISERTFDLLAASHSGYQRLAGPALHRRWIFNLKSRFWFIFDAAEGEGRHLFETFWHLAPGFEWRMKAGNSVLAANLARNETSITLLSPEGGDWTRTAGQGWHSRAYGEKTKSSVLCFQNEIELPAILATMIFPGEELSARLVLMQPASDNALPPKVIGYRCDQSNETHFFFFGKPGQNWMYQGWASDAAFLYCCTNVRNELTHSILCDGSFVDFNGSRLFTAQQRVTRHEWNGTTGLSASVSLDKVLDDKQERDSLLVPEFAAASHVRVNPREGNN